MKEFGNFLDNVVEINSFVLSEENVNSIVILSKYSRTNSFQLYRSKVDKIVLGVEKEHCEDPKPVIGVVKSEYYPDNDRFRDVFLHDSAKYFYGNYVVFLCANEYGDESEIVLKFVESEKKWKRLDPLTEKNEIRAVSWVAEATFLVNLHNPVSLIEELVNIKDINDIVEIIKDQLDNNVLPTTLIAVYGLLKRR